MDDSNQEGSPEAVGGNLSPKGRTAVMFGVGTTFHSLAPQGRGWGEGATMIPYRSAGAPSSHLLPHGEKE